MKLKSIASVVLLASVSSASLASAYSYQELSTGTLGTNQFASTIDNTGLVISTVQNRFNPPIDVSLLPLDNEDFQAQLTDLDAVAQGVFNPTDYAFLVAYIRDASRSNNQFRQQLGQYLSFSHFADTVSYINAFDTLNSEQQFTLELDTVVADSVNGSHIIGNSEGPFSPFTYVNEGENELTYNLSEFDQRAFVQVGEQVHALMPEEQTLGGLSRANAINTNLQVAGSLSTGLATGFVNAIESCDDPELRGDVPVESCYRSLFFTSNGSSVVRRSDLFVSRAVVWQLDNQGQTIDQQVYGLTIDLNETQALSSQYFSQALDINNQGVAVGSSSVVFNESFVTTAATKYENGVSVRLIEDDQLLPNSAVAINDEGYIVGIRQQRINSVTREKMFIIAPDSEQANFVQGFFESSATTPRAINNQGLVVGYADIESGNTSTRRKAGFIYNITEDKFTDINTLLPCERDFSVVEATDINDNGEIIATALASRAQRDVRGEIVQNEDGSTSMIDTVITVKLTPTGQPAPNCESEELIALERKGASTSISLFLLLFSVAFWRRTKA
mgnify:CR=1 FL=1